jgi:NitT/TauT family transport system ATP-binding protein
VETKRPVQLSIKGLSKAFSQNGGAHPVVKNLNIDVLSQEFLSIFGPNGCGKSTLVHLIAGILEPDDGTIEFAEMSRTVGIVFQNYERSLFPWRTCLDNIILPLEADKASSTRQRREIAVSLLEDLGLRLPLGHYPYQMSGGQKQLTCIARAIIHRPSILLLDEPFASLDYQTRIDMQEKLQTIWEKARITTIFVSHEIDEAIFLADRLILLSVRPARLAASFNIPLPRPRDLDALTSQPFVDLRAEILQLFRREIAL